MDISGDDVQIWLEEQGENSFALSAYCEKLLSMLREEEGRVWWMLTTLTDQVLGEIPHMRYIDSFDVLEEPKAEPLEPDDSPFVETASHAIRLDDLKFGRNYHGEE